MKFWQLQTARVDDSADVVREKIRTNARALYRETRRNYPHVTASGAWMHARSDAYVNTVWPLVELWGLVRLRLEPDDICSIDDLAGDCFDPDINDDIPRERLAREYAEFVARVNNDGVWGVIGEWRDGTAAARDDDDAAWREADSCYGFVGDDWQGSGYDSDIMRATLSALVDSVFGESDKTPDLFATDEIESLLIICRDAKRIATIGEEV